MYIGMIVTFPAASADQHLVSMVLCQTVAKTIAECQYGLACQWGEYVKRTSVIDGVPEEEAAEWLQLVDCLMGRNSEIDAWAMLVEDSEAAEFTIVVTPISSFTTTQDIVEYASGEFELTS